MKWSETMLQISCNMLNVLLEKPGAYGENRSGLRRRPLVCLNVGSTMRNSNVSPGTTRHAFPRLVPPVCFQQIYLRIFVVRKKNGNGKKKKTKTTITAVSPINVFLAAELEKEVGVIQLAGSYLSLVIQLKTAGLTLCTVQTSTNQHH